MYYMMTFGMLTGVSVVCWFERNLSVLKELGERLLLYCNCYILLQLRRAIFH